MTIVTLSSAFNTDLFWSPLSGAAIVKTATTYAFQNSAGFYVRVTGTGLAYAGDAPASGSYSAIAVYSDNTFTTQVANLSASVPADFSTFFSSGPAAVLSGDDLILDSPGNDTVFGHDGNDNIVSGNGQDTLAGGNGDDVYDVGAGDIVIEAPDGGNDTVVSARVSIDLGTAAFANVERVQLNGSLALNAFGSSGADTLFGQTNSAANVLTGRGGNDTYIIGAGDSVVETAGGGIDIVVSSTVSIDLAKPGFANVENAKLDGTLALKAFGSARANSLFGDANSAANVLAGRGGNDIYFVGAGDSVVETAGGGNDLAVSSQVNVDLGSSRFRNVENVELQGPLALKAFGSSGDNRLSGEANNTAANVLTGRGGNDTYFVGVGDRVVETRSGGTDVAISSTVDIDLGSSKFANVENVQLNGSKALKAAGSAADNVLFGATSTAANVLTGRAGNDTYVVGKGDRAVETARGGNDTASSSTINIDLASSAFANVEGARLEGAKALKAFGSAGANTLNGESNSAANVLAGRGGNDVYIVGRGDSIVETARGGTDAVYSATLSLDLRSAKLANVEDAGLLGSRALNLIGDDGANRLFGNSGANVLAGGKGLDSLTGLDGRDVFRFASVADSGLTNETRDVIFDFIHLVDRIDLSAIDADTTRGGDQRFSLLATKGAGFTGDAGELRYLKAGNNTLVEADTNGDGKGDFQILLVGSKTLSAADFDL